MDKDKLSDIFINHHGKIIGTSIGLLLGIFLLTLGFLKTLVLFLCISIGYYFGKKIDNKESIADFIDKILNQYSKK